MSYFCKLLLRIAYIESCGSYFSANFIILPPIDMQLISHSILTYAANLPIIWNVNLACIYYNELHIVSRLSFLFVEIRFYENRGTNDELFIPK